MLFPGVAALPELSILSFLSILSKMDAGKGEMIE